MKKSLIFASFAMLLLFVSFVSAFSVTPSDKGSVIISEINNPAVFNLAIQSDKADTIEIYSLVGVSMSPKGAFDVPMGVSNIEVRAFPNENLRKNTGYLDFEYQIKYTGGIYQDSLQVKIVPMKDTVTIKPSNLLPGEENAVVQITNVQNTNIDDLTVTLESEFFKNQASLSFKPYESKNVTVPIDKEKAKKLIAGPYVVTAEISLGKASAKVNGVLNYLEAQGTSIKTETTGIIVRKTSTIKANEGNVVVQDSIHSQRDIVSRLFTSYSAVPSVIDREGLTINYIWTKELNPGESWNVDVTTNYTLPFLLVILVFIIAFLVSVYSKTNLELAKTVSFVRTKNGEFALKVRVAVRAKNHVDNIQLIDRLPGVTQLYEKYGTKPNRIEMSSKRMFWDIPRLQAGEERVFTYIVYSKIKPMGRFELPPATAVYEKDGKMHENFSNRAFFASETAVGDED